MIKRNTVLVLGAGASQPYGFPLGWQLYDELCSISRRLDDDANAWLQQRGISLQRVQAFERALQYSGQNSIDAFLAHRGDLALVGKFAIALQICRRETELTLRPAADDWYGHLWRQLSRDLHKGDAWAARSLLRIVTFNYDRSLEHFLYLAALHSFDQSPEETLKQLRTIPILHVYGDVGSYAMDEASGRPYTERRPPTMLDVAIDRIRVIPDTRDDDRIFAEARRWCSEWADTICFIGFGFDPLNMRRLDLRSVIKIAGGTLPHPHIHASVLGMKQPEIGQAQSSISDRAFHAYDLKNLEFLRECGALLG